MSDVSTDGPLCCRYVDVATDAPALPAQRQCSYCPLTLPARRYNSHLRNKHSTVIFRCEECHSYLDKDDLLFHMNTHGFWFPSDKLKAEYYKNKKAVLGDEASINELSQIEIDKLNDFFRRTEEILDRANVQNLRTKVKINMLQSEDDKEKVEKVSADTEVTDKTPRREAGEVKDGGPAEQESDMDLSSSKRKRIGAKRSSEAEPSPPKRQKKNKKLSAAKGGHLVKDFDDRDDGNDGDDEVNTPLGSPTGKAVKVKEDGSDKSPKGSRTCPICGKQYRASSSYFYHMKYFHKRSREHECSVCNKKFGTKGNLAQHASIHTGAYDLECKECGKRFKSKPSLYIHEQSHGGPKRWACAQCGRSFRWRTHLARHVTRHAAERAHVCGTCGRGFSVRCDLLRHARTHAADEFHCATCGIKFAQKRYLQVHVAKKHPEAPSQVVTRS